MSYKCAGCEKTVGPNVPMRRHTIFRVVTEPYGEGTRSFNQVAKELPVCEECAPKMFESEMERKFGK